MVTSESGSATEAPLHIQHQTPRPRRIHIRPTAQRPNTGRPPRTTEGNQSHHTSPKQGTAARRHCDMDSRRRTTQQPTVVQRNAGRQRARNRIHQQGAKPDDSRQTGFLIKQVEENGSKFLILNNTGDLEPQLASLTRGNVYNRFRGIVSRARCKTTRSPLFSRKNAAR